MKALGPAGAELGEVRLVEPEAVMDLDRDPAEVTLGQELGTVSGALHSLTAGNAPTAPLFPLLKALGQRA